MTEFGRSPLLSARQLAAMGYCMVIFPLTAFRVSIPVKGDSFKLSGQPTIYIKTTADSGNPRAQAFCGKCGSPLYSTTPGEGQQAMYIVRVGILQQRDQLEPKRQIWWRSARPWVTGLDGIRKIEKQT